MLSSFLRSVSIHGTWLQGMAALALMALALLGAPASEAQTFDEAEAAYKRGDYAVAFEAFSTLAERGDAEAQYKLGSSVP